MEDILWFVFAGSRGGATRIEIVRALRERPRNANELATDLAYDYTTIRHHLDVLVENNVLRSVGDGYGDVYLLSEAMAAEQESLDRVLTALEESR